MIFSKGYRPVLFDPNHRRTLVPKFMHTTLFCSYFQEPSWKEVSRSIESFKPFSSALPVIGRIPRKSIYISQSEFIVLTPAIPARSANGGKCSRNEMKIQAVSSPHPAKSKSMCWSSIEQLSSSRKVASFFRPIIFTPNVSNMPVEKKINILESWPLQREDGLEGEGQGDVVVYQ